MNPQQIQCPFIPVAAWLYMKTKFVIWRTAKNIDIDKRHIKMDFECFFFIIDRMSQITKRNLLLTFSQQKVFTDTLNNLFSEIKWITTIYDYQLTNLI